MGSLAPRQEDLVVIVDLQRAVSNAGRPSPVESIGWVLPEALLKGLRWLPALAERARRMALRGSRPCRPATVHAAQPRCPGTWKRSRTYRYPRDDPQRSS